VQVGQGALAAAAVDDLALLVAQGVVDADDLVRGDELLGHGSSCAQRAPYPVLPLRAAVVAHNGRRRLGSGIEYGGDPEDPDVTALSDRQKALLMALRDAEAAGGPVDLG